jgi:hypothetical protein
LVPAPISSYHSCFIFHRRHILPAQPILEVRAHLSLVECCKSIIDACIGGDVFVLHRDNSSASAHSRRRSLLSAPGSPAYEGVPRLITTLAEEESSVPTYEASSSPLVVVHSPAVSRRGSFTRDESPSKITDEETDLADLAAEGSGSALDPSSIPLRVVYSPAASRSQSIGHTSHSQKPSIVSNRERYLEDSDRDQTLPYDEFSPTSPLFDASFPSENQVYRRRGSTASNTEARIPSFNVPSPSLRPPSNNRTPAERTSFGEDGDEEDLSPHVFMAFPERKGLRKIVVAKIALGIVTCCVLGNLIYT